jgi:putative FmdB family regulatory protein
MYEYRCEGCGEGFEIVQPMSARAEDTVCPHCKAKKAVRLLSAFASKIVGDHKPGFSEMKAYRQAQAPRRPSCVRLRLGRRQLVLTCARPLPSCSAWGCC